MFIIKNSCTLDATPDSDGLTPSEPLMSPGEDEDLAVELPGVGVGGMSSQSGLAGSGRRVVSEAEWNLLHEEIRRARSRFGRSCQLCAANQANLQKVMTIFSLGIQSHVYDFLSTFDFKPLE